MSVPGSVRLLSWPHAFRVAGGAALVISMLLGHLPALFAIPAGLGDMAVGLAEPFVARQARVGRGRRAVRSLNILGLLDLLTAMTLGGLTAYGIVHVSPVNNALSQLPLVLIPTIEVPMLFALHILTLRRLRATSSMRPPVDRALSPNTVQAGSSVANHANDERPNNASLSA